MMRSVSITAVLLNRVTRDCWEKSGLPSSNGSASQRSCVNFVNTYCVRGKRSVHDDGLIYASSCSLPTLVNLRFMILTKLFVYYWNRGMCVVTGGACRQVMRGSECLGLKIFCCGDEIVFCI